MKNDVLVACQSRTGFTRSYAAQIAAALHCPALELNELLRTGLTGCRLLIFGGGLHAGQIDGLAKVKKLLQRSQVERFILFATGAMPAENQRAAEEMWRANLTQAQLQTIPHFYLPGGLRYEGMALPDRLLMKAAARLMQKDPKMPPAAREMLTHSYDLRDPAYALPLIEQAQALCP